ncbi:MAG: hypothetical protein RI980_195 [Bacteroidota bacterium]|jgi:hypothetical protein|nr:MAG: hypothetical protein EAY77_01295 [Flavobacteriia bacterium]
MKNPKQKLKNILLLVTVLFTFSCSKDAYDENLNIDTRDYRFKKINFQELRNINNQAFIESAKLKKVLPADKHNSIESISDFDIDLQNIQYLKKTNNQETFSFRVLQSATATFSQNIVIDCKPNQSPQTYLVTYYLNKHLGQISNNDMFMNSITSTSTARLNSSSSNVTNTSGCLEVGYYEEVDYCEGELTTPGENPECFNNDGSRRKVLVFKVLASDCSTSGGEDFIPDVLEWMNNHQNPSNPSSGNENNGLGGGGENSSNTDIFIPNYFNSDDLSNPATQNMLQINQFIYNLYASDNAIKNVVESTEWLLAYTNYWIGVNGGLSSSNQNALTYAFNNMPSVFYQYPDTINTQAQISLFQYNAFQFLLQHGEWLSGQSATTKQSILQNLTSLEKIEKLDGLIDIASENNINFDYHSFSNSNSNQNLMNFNSITELNTFVQSLNNGSQGDGADVSNLETQNQFFSTKKIRISSTHTIIVEVVANKGSNITLDNQSNSYLDGFLPGNTWVQTTMSMTNQNYSSNEAQITLTGYLNIGIKYEEFEFGFKNRKKIKFLINKSNGTLCCSVTTNLD